MFAFVPFAFVTKGEANEGFRTVRRDCCGIARYGLWRAPRHVDLTNDAAELVQHGEIEPIQSFVIVTDGLFEPVVPGSVELLELQSIVERQLEHAAVEHSVGHEQGQGQEQVIVGSAQISDESLSAP